MANEISLSSAVTYAKSGKSFDTDDLDLLGLQLTVSGSNHLRNTQTATATPTALGKGSIGTCGLLIGRNRGSVNVLIRSGSGGTDTICFPAGIGYPVYLNITTPYISTPSSTAEFEYELVEA